MPSPDEASVPTEVIAEYHHALAEEIREKGHYQGIGRDFGSCLVANNALNIVSAKHDISNGKLLLASLAVFRAQGIADTVEWNDATPTDEVLALLESL